jgi:hypothetical protein
MDRGLPRGFLGWSRLGGPRAVRRGVPSAGQSRRRREKITGAHLINEAVDLWFIRQEIKFSDQSIQNILKHGVCVKYFEMFDLYEFLLIGETYNPH